MKFARLMLGASLAALCSTVPAFAQSATPSASETAVYDFDIPEQSLASALNSFAQTADVQFAYSADLVAGRSGRPLKGRYTVQEALARLLAGTGLTWHAGAGKAIVLDVAGGVSGDGERVLGAVRVQGAENSGLPGSTAVNGINGSRDVTATEGTGSYTSNALTIGSKTAASIKDTPMAVSVLTSQRLQDQNITDLATAMRNLPGVTVLADPNGNPTFYSRGFQVTQFSFDGGAPFDVTGAGGVYKPVIDMSLYDHIELLRGAAGTFNAYGNPGGTVNLVRKRPLDHTQLLLEGQVGSWDWYRFSADLTGPLGLGGRLRGRLIATHQDNKYFYDVAKTSRDVVSGTIELDVTPSTLLTVGATYQNSHDNPFSSGLMRYQDGRALGLPRSTCFCFDWAKSDAENREIFGQIEQKIDASWNLKVKATKIKQVGISRYPSISGSINPYTLIGARANAGGSPSESHLSQTMFELTLDGKFRLFGRDQKLVFGASYSMPDATGTFYTFSYDPATGVGYPFPGKSSTAVDVFHYNSSQWLEPVSNAAKSYEVLFDDSRYLNSYMTFELNPIKHLFMTAGLRYSQVRARAAGNRGCDYYYIQRNIYGCGSKKPGDLVFEPSGASGVKSTDFSWPPSILWRYELTNNLNVSAIYTDIYIDQSIFKQRDGSPLPPITGGNFEGALKWASPDKKLNINLSGYYTRQTNVGSYPDCNSDGVPSTDPSYIPGAPVCSSTDTPEDLRSPTNLNNHSQCCFIASPNQKNISYGLDLEVSGQIRRGWQLSASYNYNINYYKDDDYHQTLFNGQPKPLIDNRILPRHKMQIWTTYTFEDSGKFAGLVIGLGANAQSIGQYVDRYCTTYGPNSQTSLQECKAYTDVKFNDPGRIVFNGSLGYKINDNFRVDLQVENLLDKTYYEQIGGIGGGNRYGAPRNFKLSMRGKF